ncbi:MAG: 2-dehydropantoate 2-reductase [Candidatus Lokiarchaeota archaeon]|nr:2-dehydropantoate 2-reductase [Candidatus Lokiarchaeota archaeon]
MKDIRDIWICGVGGVGGYFGGRLAFSISKINNPKYRIFFYARGKHLKEIQNNGLELHTSRGEKLICRPTLASDDINDFPPPDLCIICVKSYDLDNLIIKIRDKLTEDTIIISLMNGIDIYERIRKSLKKCIILPSCVFIGSHIEKPGLILHSGNPGFFYCGFDPLYIKFNPQHILDFFKKFGIDMRWKDNPNLKIWEKYLLVASFALVSAHTDQTLGEIIYDEKSHKILVNIMEEIILIAQAKGIELSKTIIKDTVEFCKDYPNVKPSYVRDIKKGKKNEGDLFGGTIIRIGKKFGISTPDTISIYKEFKPQII